MSSVNGKRGSKSRKRELGHAPVSTVAIGDVTPSPENDEIYRPVDASDPELIALAKSIRTDGILEPLVVTSDSYILSGHRRYAAAQLAGLEEIPVRVDPIRRTDDRDRFIARLREHNRQRTKSLSERVCEELISTNPDEAYQSLVDQRRAASRVSVDSMYIEGQMRRCEISDAKIPFLQAVQGVIEEMEEFWPLSARQIHYVLLNDPPLRHAKKPTSVYRNDSKSYKSLVELLTRARLDGSVEMGVVSDETRPVKVWMVDREPGTFIQRHLDGFLRGYSRDRLQSQPNHIEIVCEKNTIDGIITPIAMDYCIPITSGRGYCSLPPRHAIAQRYRNSGKTKLILLIVSDFDPDGEEIAQSLARSIRDDFCVDEIHPIKVALTADQVGELDLPVSSKAKPGSSQYHKFIGRHGEDVYELESLKPRQLQQILRDAIDSVLDIDAYNHEVDSEKRDAAEVQSLKKVAYRTFTELTGGAPE